MAKTRVQMEQAPTAPELIQNDEKTGEPEQVFVDPYVERRVLRKLDFRVVPLASIAPAYP